MLLVILIAFAAITKTGHQAPPPHDDSWYMKVTGEAGQVTLPLGQRDLGLNSDQVEKVRAIAATLESNKKTEQEKLNPESRRLGDLDPATKKQILGLQDNLQIAMDIQLVNMLTHEQFIRYKQISIQRRGSLAFTKKDIVNVLSMNEEQQNKATEIVKKTIKEYESLENEYMVKRQNDFKKGVKPGNAREFIIQRNMITKKAVAECVGILDERQKEQWKNMTGPIVDELADP